MRKNVFGRQFKRDTNERKALFKNLMTSLVLYDQIKTTEAKAKAIRGSVEKLVTKAKKKGDLATPLLLPYLHESAVKRMLREIAPRFTNRPGGYTRIIRLGKRLGDDATEVIIEWVEKGVVKPATKKSKKTAVVESTLEVKEANKKEKKSVVKKKEKKTEKKTVKKTKQEEKK